MSELLRKSQQVILAGIESEYGTAETLDGSNAMLVSDLDVQMLEADVQDRNNVVGYMGSQGGITVGRKITASFGVELSGSGSAAAPAWSPLLMACGFAQVGTLFTPVDSEFPALTMLYRIGKVQQKLVGSRGNMSINLDQGTIPKLMFSYQSLYEDPTVEGTYLTGVDLAAFKSPVGVTDVVTSVTFLGSAVKMKKLTIDAGVMIEHDKHTEGESIEVGGRAGKVSMSFRTDETELVTMIQNGSNNVEGGLTAVHGVTSGNILTVDVPNLQIKTAKVAWDGEFANVDITADIKPLSANTDFSIEQT